MTDSTLIADLIRSGLSPELVGRVVAALLSASVRGTIRETHRTPSNEESNCVYALVDTRSNEIFYIGITLYPDERLYQHRSDPTSTPWQKIKDIEQAGGIVEMRVLERGLERQAALDKEHELIASLPNLINVVRDKVRLSGTIAIGAKEYERRRKAEWRAKSKETAKANDVAVQRAVPPNVPEMSRTVPDAPCNLLTSLSSFESEKERKMSSEKGRKGSENTRARGTRLLPDQSISEADWSFAIDAGMAPPAIRQAWSEFVDYWIAVPGHRGTKLNWSATWRNRVRELIKRGRFNGSPQVRSDNSAIAALERLPNTFATRDAFAAYGLCPEEGATPIVQLPARRLR